MVNLGINKIVTSEGFNQCRIRRWCIGILVMCGLYMCICAYISDRFQVTTMQSVVPAMHSVVATEAGGNQLQWSPYMDILDEKTALKDPPLQDINNGVNINNSKVYILGDRVSYEVGDTVAVCIDLFDGYGKRRYRGGDQLRVRIFEKSLKNSAAGYVIDHQNGSYTAVLRCLWAGTPTILVYISYTREAVRALYHIRNQLPSTHDTYVTYENKEVKRCHPFTTKLKSANLCNLTLKNDNMSWYCEAPTSAGSSCRFVDTQVPPLKGSLPITSAEKMLFRLNGKHLTPALQITIKEEGIHPNTIETKTPCYLYNRTKLWFQPSPVGHFVNGQWQTEHCEIKTEHKLARCLLNKHIFLYGDSTSRQWFSNLAQRYQCTFKTKAWTTVKWKQDSIAFCPQFNLTISWIVHSLPGIVKSKRTVINSFSKTMIRFAKNKNAIVVIHMMVHLSQYHHGVFRNRMANIRKIVDTILKVNKDAKILIKGSHTFQSSGQVNDYYGYIFRTIQIEEFKQLYDKVVYLDNKDITIAEEVSNLHPPNTIVTQMINQMLAYVCE